jgi:dipeptidyl aminopeptidase/acylaminoacyl peptidase
MTTRARVGLGVGGGAALLLVAVLLRFGPAVLLSLSLAVPATEAWLAPAYAEPVREEITIARNGRRISADLYRPPSPRAALVIVHGLSRAGRRHPEIVRLARLLAQRRQLVVVPQVAGLADFVLSGTEVEDIAAVLRDVAARGHPVGIAGFSFGAGPALLAAAEVPDVRVAGSFGGYADRRTLGAIAARRLANPADDTGDLQARLDAPGRAVLRLALNREEASVAPLVAALSPETRAMLARLSPLAIVPRLRGRLLVAHGEADDSIPFTESLRLGEAARGRARVAILRTFHHTGPQAVWTSLALRAADGWNLMRLVDGLL